MKRVFPFLILMIFVACQKEEPAPQKPDDALASVGGVYITEEDFNKQLEEADTIYKKFLTTGFGKSSLLDVMVREKLMRQDAASMDIADDADYKKIISDLKQAQEDHFKQVESDAILEVWTKKLEEKGVTSVTDQEIADYAKRHQYEMTVMIMNIPNAADADAVLRDLRASPDKEQRFTALAKKYSIDPNGELSGGLTITFIPGEYIEAIENAAANSPAGTVQGFIKTSRGFTIIYKKKEERISLAQAKDRIKNILMKKKFDQYLSELAEKSKVEVYKTYEN